MQAERPVSPEEYLTTTYEPDCDFVDGVLEERNLGKRRHSRTQARLLMFLGVREAQWGIYVLPEQRLRISATRVRIPDISVFEGPIVEEVPALPPFLCIEILSPEDRLSRVQHRIDDYFVMGVQHVWLLDPESRRAWTCTSGLMSEIRDGTLRAGFIEVPLEGILPES